MSQSSTPATRNEATQRFNPPEGTTFSRTRHRHGHTALTRTVASGCGRLRTVVDANATSSERTLNPQTPRVRREPLLRIQEKECFIIWSVDDNVIKCDPMTMLSKARQFLWYLCCMWERDDMNIAYKTFRATQTHNYRNSGLWRARPGPLTKSKRKG